MIRRLRRLSLALTLASAGASCADAPHDPVALLVAPEARAALQVGSRLPTLPDLIHRLPANSAGGAQLERAEVLWQQAQTTVREDSARALRESAYAAAAPALAGGLDGAALASVDDQLDRWLTLAGAALRRVDVPELSRALLDAEEYLRQARSAQAGGEHAAAVVATLHAADRLAETTPQGVAARLCTRNEAALDTLRHLPGRPVSEEARRRIERIDRLVRGAREALSAGQLELAIRRGYYARQLLQSEGALTGG